MGNIVYGALRMQHRKSPLPLIYCFFICLNADTKYLTQKNIYKNWPNKYFNSMNAKIPQHFFCKIYECILSILLRLISLRDLYNISDQMESEIEFHLKRP